jgi:DNA-binding CsgD family transcriptional regulator
MVDIMEGFSQIEIRERHGWSDNHTRVLFRHLRTTFYEAITGHKRPPCGYVGSKAPATDEELRQLCELRGQGLSYVKIGARLGYSQGWVMQNLRRSQHHRPTIIEREQDRNKRIAEVQALLTRGMSYRDIAVTLGTSYNTVRRLLGKC